MYRYQCSACSQKRLTSQLYSTPPKDNTKNNMNTAAGSSQGTKSNPVKPTPLPGIHSIFRPGYHVNIGDCKSSVKIDLTCDKNRKSSINDDNIAGHGSGHDSKQSDICVTCSQPIAEHRPRHTVEKSSSCAAHVEASPNQESKHSGTHTGKKNYSYSTTLKSFERVKRLSSDNSDELFVQKGILLFHKDATYFTCTICARVFLKRAQLTTHIRSHTGDKPYSCETCAKSFSQHSTLTAHIRIHTGEKPYVCTICDRRYGHSSTLIRHKRSQHKQTNSPDSLL